MQRPAPRKPPHPRRPPDRTGRPLARLPNRLPNRPRGRSGVPRRASGRILARPFGRPFARALSQALGRALTRPFARVLARISERRPGGLLEPKRLLDLTLGSALLLLASPVLAVAALALALSRPAGGVRVRDYRTGLNGHPFLLSSLRTRRLRLDLLSRLPHVVRGDLSLVGPAPLKFGAPAAAAPWRQLVRPGLTGLAQVRRGSALPWDEAALLDQHYVEHHWIGLDLAILARTPAAALLAPPARRVPARRIPVRRAPALRGRAPWATQITGRPATLRRNKWVPSARAD
ncbi:sugar transferase [Streptomyces sp. NPDC091212]|uniref:sugar transferase n=1 Tax=Streptomyces sp. NPDC091212 TaxID=3155191 RepID=UPI003414C333